MKIALTDTRKECMEYAADVAEEMGAALLTTTAGIQKMAERKKMPDCLLTIDPTNLKNSTVPLVIDNLPIVMESILRKHFGFQGKLIYATMVVDKVCE